MRKTSVMLMLAMLLAVMLCATPARADVLVPEFDDEGISEELVDDEADEDLDGDGEVDEDVDELDDDDGEDDADDADPDSADGSTSTDDRSGLPLLPLAAGVAAIAGGAAVYIIRSRA